MVFFMLLLAPKVSVASFYHDFYVDHETAGMLEAAFRAQLDSEQRLGGYLDEIMKSYGRANLAVAGIMAVKHLERKALHDAGILGVPGQENYYYQHIYKLVFSRIIPQILRCGVLLVDHIDQVYVWGPQLQMICTEVRDLCGQFSAVVGNGALTFNFGFPQVADEVLDILGISGLQGIDWNDFLDSIGDIDIRDGVDKMTDDFKDDINGIYSAGRSLLSGSYDAAGDLWEGRSNVVKLFSGKPTELKSRIDSLKQYFEDVTDKHALKDKLGSVLGAVDSVSIINRFFTYRDCRPEDFIHDFSGSGRSSYYRQRWYITGNGRTVHEETFDSSSMEEGAFRKKMEGRLNEYLVLDDGVDYELQKDSKQYYTLPDELNLKGVHQAVFYLHCDFGGSIGDGSYTFKVDPRHDPLNEQSKQYAMATEREPSDFRDRDACTRRLDYWDSEYDRLKGIVDGLSDDIDRLYYEMGEGKLTSDGLPIETAIANLESQRTSYSRELRTASDSLRIYDNMLDEINDDLVDDGDIFRIPHIMRTYEGMFGLRWLDDGHWEDYTWVRRCYYPGADENMTLRVELERDAGEKFFLGIRIHRSRITMNYALYYESPTDNAVEYLDLDPQRSEEENAAIVQEHMRQWQEDFPDCVVDVETRVGEDLKDSIDNHTVHLLWASDRVRIARMVNARLEIIFARLQVMERTLRFSKSLFERFKDSVTEIYRRPVNRIWTYRFLEERRERLLNNMSATPRRREEGG